MIRVYSGSVLLEQAYVRDFPVFMLGDFTAATRPRVFRFERCVGVHAHLDGGPGGVDTDYWLCPQTAPSFNRGACLDSHHSHFRLHMSFNNQHVGCLPVPMQSMSHPSRDIGRQGFCVDLVHSPCIAIIVRAILRGVVCQHDCDTLWLADS